MKKVLSNRIFLLIIGGILVSVTGVLAVNISASNISYGNTTLDQALDSLYTTQTTTVTNLQNENSSLTTSNNNLLELNTSLTEANQTLAQENASLQTQLNNASASDPKYNYSTTEQQIGTWIDGKPLYQITYSIGTINFNASSSDRTVRNLANLSIDTFIDYEFFGRLSSGNVIVLPYSDGKDGMDLSYNVSSKNLLVYSNITSPFYDCILTVRYTKTTDSVPSGNNQG